MELTIGIKIIKRILSCKYSYRMGKSITLKNVPNVFFFLSIQTPTVYCVFSDLVIRALYHRWGSCCSKLM